jgi:hypothetical protein
VEPDSDSTKNLIQIQSVKINVSDPDSIRSVDPDPDSESRADSGGQKITFRRAFIFQLINEYIV